MHSHLAHITKIDEFRALKFLFISDSDDSQGVALSASIGNYFSLHGPLLAEPVAPAARGAGGGFPEGRVLRVKGLIVPAVGGGDSAGRSSMGTPAGPFAAGARAMACGVP